MYKITVSNALTMATVFVDFRSNEKDAEALASAYYDPEGNKFNRCLVSTWELLA